MNREQFERQNFERRFQAFQIPKDELDRMFRREKEIKEQMQMLAEQAFQQALALEASSGVGGPPNSIPPSPTPSSSNLRSTLIYWQDATSGTWKFFVHDYAANTSSDIFDTELDYTVYTNVDDNEIIEQAGYAWQVQDNASGDRVVFCVQADGTLIESFTYNTTGVSGRRNFEFISQVYYWVDGGQTYFKIFDGNTVGSASLPSAISSLSFNTAGGEASKNRTVSFKVDGTTTYVLSPAGDLVDVTSEVGNNYSYSISLQSDFLCFTNRDGSSVPQSVVIFNEDGTLKNTFDLTTLGIASLNNQGVYGENQWSALYQDGSNDWVWVKYDYTGDTFSTETHPNANYNNVSRYQDFRETIDSFTNSQLNSVNVLYSGDVAATWGNNYDYLAFLWSIGSGGTHQEDVTVGTPIEILYGGTTLVSDYPSFLAGPVGGTGFINVGILTDNSTIQYSPTGQLSQDCAAAFNYLVGNTSMYVFSTTGGDTLFEFWITSQVQTHTVVGSTNWSYYINGSTLVAINNDDYNQSFWYTENSPTINAMPALANFDSDDNQTWGSLTGVQESRQIFWERNGNSQPFSKLYILTNENGLSAEITGNNTSSSVVDLEGTVFDWEYSDPTTSNVIISQYSLLTGLELASVDTGVSSLTGNSQYASRSLSWASDTPTVGSVTLWLQGPGGTTTTVIETGTWDYSHNDSEWAD